MCLKTPFLPYRSVGRTDRQTDGRTEGSQHRLILPYTFGGGNITRSSATAKSTARLSSCLVGVLALGIKSVIADQPLLRNWSRKLLCSVEITQNNGHFAVQGHSRSSVFGINRKPICDFLLVINTNLPPILHRFQVMADYWSNFL